jgi:N-acetylglucosaminyldiphosphoundecaprenol N-acetyl-beta-D-mannosaminyltransferase
VPPLEKKIELFGLPFEARPLAESVEFLYQKICERSSKACVVVTPNLDHLVQMHKRAGLRDLYRQADLFFADGFPIVVSSMLLGRPLPGRSPGPDLTKRLIAACARDRKKIFVLGGFPGEGDTIKRKLEARFPGLQAFVYTPSRAFVPDGPEGEAIVRSVAEIRPDVLFACLGLPKQEIFAITHRASLDVPVVMCVGAAVDFLVGKARRAPRMVQRVGLEWLWRLSSNPRRLWRRYLVDDVAFLPLLAKELIHQRRGNRAA